MLTSHICKAVHNMRYLQKCRVLSPVTFIWQVIGVCKGSAFITPKYFYFDIIQPQYQCQIQKFKSGVYNVSAQSSFIANANNKLYAFRIGKDDLLEKI